MYIQSWKPHLSFIPLRQRPQGEIRNDLFQISLSGDCGIDHSVKPYYLGGYMIRVNVLETLRPETIGFR